MFLLVVLIVVFTVLPSPASFWSIGNFMVTGGSVIEPYIDLIALGIQVGQQECQYQFKWSRWNCPESAYGNILNPAKRNRIKATKESAFMHAVMNAAIVHTIVTKCQTGQHKNCTCSVDKNPDDFSVKGCSAAIKNAIKITRDFVDKKERLDTWGSINIHNNQVGRQIVQKTMKKVCKCHGVSGSCNMKSCWLKINDFHWIGKRLKLAYKMAKKVGEENDLEKVASFKPFQSSLIYQEESPDYCYPNRSAGSIGTLGRQCAKGSRTNGSMETDDDKSNCNKLCRQCGYNVKEVLDTNNFNCNCSFVWCCKVQCAVCPPRIVSVCSV
ncbi:protein Wnt-8b-like [Tetranychus urticae]|uniref:Protein Wnt n=1 Tax=Tetranychus urticae TaxID=32264 RepID=T1KT26_TETUR|nr:protein Wnt-8b-like [Tetranychus urticae]